jgi:hypothetical protein
MKILFVKKLSTGILDGGDIYDIKLINGLKKLGNEVTEYTIKQGKKGVFPFWKWQISNHDIVSINSIQGDYDKTIISHENIADLSKHIECDLYIFHNLMSKIRGTILLAMFYRIGSKYHERKAIRNSKEVLVLSFREFSLLRSGKPNYCPPGINESLIQDDDKSVIFLPSSSGWMLKKLSKLGVRETSHINKYFEIKEDNKFSRVGIIEDKFDCGFKLRLIQMLYSCDIIITKLDYKCEINALGCSSKNVFRYKNFTNVNFDVLLDEIDYEVNYNNRKQLSSNYNWNSIATNIVNIL